MSDKQKKENGVAREYLESDLVPESVKNQLRKSLDTSEKKPEKTPVVKAQPAAIETVNTDKPIEKEVIAPNELKPEIVDTPTLEIEEDPNKLEDPKKIDGLEKEEILDDPNVDYRQKYLTIKGKYDAELPRFQQAIKANGEVILWQKGKITELETRLKSAAPGAVPANIDFSEEGKTRLAELGYDEPSEIQDILAVFNSESQGLRQENATLKSSVPVVNQGPQPYDGILLSNSFVDSQSMRSQSNYEMAMDYYKEFGTSAREFLDKALASNDFETAAEILSQVQTCMVKDGFWNGPHPLTVNDPPPVDLIPPVKEPVKLPPKAVLPHSKTVVPSVPVPALGLSVLTKASEDLIKGRITHEAYEKIQNKVVQEQAEASPG